MSVALNQRSIGDVVRPKIDISRIKIQNFVYTKDCNFQGGLSPAARLTIKEINTKLAGKFWIILEIRTDPPTQLKLSGEEFAMNFV